MSKYISLENLERYDAKMQERTASFCASKADGMWRQTEKAGAVSFWPVGNSPLEGTVEFLFTETPPTSGDKSPDNPSAISGVSSISLTVCQEEDVDEHSYTLSLGGTYYGGSIDLATGVMTVTWWGHAFNGTETWRENGTVGTNYRHWVRLSENGFPDPVTGSAYQLCNHCTYYYSFNAGLGRFFANNAESGGGIFFDDKDAIYPSTESWANWLASEYAAGHPVVVTYQLITPQTVQLTPLQILSLPQPDKYVPRLNTVYTDADAVQIVYQKNPVRDKFEKVQAIIAQGGNV